MNSLVDALRFSLQLTLEQKFGLAFLLGSFSVATLSDIKRLSAQREFLEVWLVFILVVLGYDALEAHDNPEHWPVIAVKWGLIVLLSVLSLAKVGVLFRLAPGDVAALAAAASLLTPPLIIVFYLIAKVFAWFVGTFIWPRAAYWAFMPVVSLTTLAVLALGFLS